MPRNEATIFNGKFHPLGFGTRFCLIFYYVLQIRTFNIFKVSSVWPQFQFKSRSPHGCKEYLSAAIRSGKTHHLRHSKHVVHCHLLSTGIQYHEQCILNQTLKICIICKLLVLIQVIRIRILY